MVTRHVLAMFSLYVSIANSPVILEGASASSPTMQQTTGFIHDRLLGQAQSNDLGVPISSVTVNCDAMEWTYTTPLNGQYMGGTHTLTTKWHVPIQSVTVIPNSAAFGLACKLQKPCILLTTVGPSTSSPAMTELASGVVPDVRPPTMGPKLINAFRYLQELCKVQRQ